MFKSIISKGRFIKKAKFVLLPTLAIASLSVLAAQTITATNGFPSDYGTASSEATSRLVQKAPNVQNVTVSCYTFPRQSSFAGRWICTAKGTI